MNLLDGDISDELRALYPLTIPANSKASVTWDLPIPAHIKGRATSGSDKAKHGAWTTERWLDENGLTYKGPGGSAEPNGATCPTSATTSSTTTTTTTTTAVPVTTSTSTTTTSTSTSTTKPEAQPVQIRPASLYSTSNSQVAARAGDGDPATEFVTQMLDSSAPTWAWLNADLGEDVPLVRIDWMWSAPGAADEFRIDVSIDGVSWTTVAKPGETPVGGWNSLQMNQKVRIVRFSFHNPQHDPQLGHLAEVRFFAANGFVAGDHPQVLSAEEITSRAEVSVRPPTGASMSGDRYKVKRSSRSSNSPAASSHLTLDGKVATAWQTAMVVPPRSGWTAYDLGDTVALGRIRWKFSTIGYRRQVRTAELARWSALDDVRQGGQRSHGERLGLVEHQREDPIRAIPLLQPEQGRQHRIPVRGAVLRHEVRPGPGVELALGGRVRMPSSSSCLTSTGVGALVIGSMPDCVFGKAMTSRMFSSPARIATRRSMPKAKPPWGGAP